MLKVEGVDLKYGAAQVLRGVQLEARKGEVTSLMGRNGVGKTTLLRAIAGLVAPVAGTIRLDGEPGEATIGELAHYVSHANAVKAGLTVHENARFWARFLGGDASGADGALDAIGLGEISGVPAAYLSAGQKRRLGLARLLLAPRPLWLLDEPTVSLDAASQGWLARLMQTHLDGGGLIVAATHAPMGLAAARTLELVAPAVPAVAAT